MTEPKFKAGDRVKVRGYSSQGANVNGSFGKIAKLFVADTAVVDIKNGIGEIYSYVLCLSQLIKLKTKKRREIWVNEYDDGFTYWQFHNSLSEAQEHLNTSGNKPKRTIRFVESKEK